MRAFLCRVSSVLFHCTDWHFVDGSCSKTHDTSPVMICPRSVRSASQMFKNISAMKTRSFFCSSVKAFKTRFEQTFFISKFWCRILGTHVHEINVLSAPSLIICRQPFSISCFIFSMLCALHAVARRTVRASSFTNSLPLWKWPTYFFTAVLFNGCMPYTLVSSFIISAFVLFFYTRNSSTKCCSVYSRSALIV